MSRHRVKKLRTKEINYLNKRRPWSEIRILFYTSTSLEISLGLLEYQGRHSENGSALFVKVLTFQQTLNIKTHYLDIYFLFFFFYFGLFQTVNRCSQVQWSRKPSNKMNLYLIFKKKFKIIKFLCFALIFFYIYILFIFVYKM